MHKIQFGMLVAIIIMALNGLGLLGLAAPVITFEADSQPDYQIMDDFNKWYDAQADKTGVVHKLEYISPRLEVHFYSIRPLQQEFFPKKGSVNTYNSF